MMGMMGACRCHARAGGRGVRPGRSGGADHRLAGLLALTACTSSGSTAAGPPSAGTTPEIRHPGGAGRRAPSSRRTARCTGTPAPGSLPEGVPDCTMLSVPVNYADPGGRHISLALDMVPATAPQSQQQGIMLVNPGGPGGAGCRWRPRWRRAQPGRGRRLRHRRLRPARRRVLRARAELRPELFHRPGRTTYRPIPPPSRCSSTGRKCTPTIASRNSAGCCPT
jgi:hypothetical protein